VARSAGADDIDLSAATVHLIDSDTATTLTAADSASEDTFAVEAIEDGDDSVPVLTTKPTGSRVG